MGWMGTGQGTVFLAGQPHNQVINGTTYYPVVGYEVTFTNNTAVTADIAGWVVAFYDSSGTELGSDQETATPSFLTTGQSFSWTEYALTDTQGNPQSIGSDQNIPSDGSASTCQVIQWTNGNG
jgi:hypothetical protein